MCFLWFSHGKTWKLQNISEDWQFITWQVGLSCGVCQIFREDRKVKQIYVKSVPCLLTDEKEQQIFWPIKMTVVFHPHDMSDFILFLKMRKHLMMASFSGCHWNSGTITDHPVLVSKKSGPAVAEMLDLLHNLRKGLLWSGQNWPITEAGVCLATNSASEVMDIPS